MDRIVQLAFGETGVVYRVTRGHRGGRLAWKREWQSNGADASFSRLRRRLMNAGRAFVELYGKHRMICKRETVRCAGVQQVKESEGALTKLRPT